MATELEPIRVLIADDSPLAREFIKEILLRAPDIKVVGEAANGREAVETALSIRPDMIIMDIEMPVMGGLDAIESILSVAGVPILVVTSQGDADTAYKAISLGALEVMPKSDLDPASPQKLISNIRTLSKVKVVKRRPPKRREGPELGDKTGEGFRNIVAIASSTGGPKALSLILPELPKDYPAPIVIAQHIADGFAHGMVNWLKSICKIGVTIPSDGEKLKPGWAYVSPSERHMIVNGAGSVSFRDREPGDIYKPSCNALLGAVGDMYGARSIGVVLTGMGSDGAEGLKKIKRRGGRTIAQNEETSIVFGMPKVAIDAKCVDRVLPLDAIAKALMEMV